MTTTTIQRQRQQLAHLKKQTKVLLQYISTLEASLIELNREKRKLDDENYELRYGHPPDWAHGC